MINTKPKAGIGSGIYFQTRKGETMNSLDVCMWYEAAMDAIDTKMSSIRHRLQNMPAVDMTVQDLQAAQEFLSVLCQAEAVLTDYEEADVV